MDEGHIVLLFILVILFAFIFYKYTNKNNINWGPTGPLMDIPGDVNARPTVPVS
jgi:hypothetical protein